TFLLSPLLPPLPTATLSPYTTLFRSIRKLIPLFNSRIKQLVSKGIIRTSLSRSCSKRASNTFFLSHTTSNKSVICRPITCSFNRSEEHTSELQSRFDLVCRLLLEKKK